VQPGAQPENLLGGKTTIDLTLFFNVPCFQSIIHEMCMFLALPPEQLCSDLSRQIKGLLSLN